MSKKSIQIIFNSIFSFVSLYFLFNYMDSITSALIDNRLNLQILVQLIRKLKMQLPLLFLGGALYISILVSFALFLDKRYPSDKHKDMQ